MGKYSEAFVAFDGAKKKHAVAVAEGGRTARSSVSRRRREQPFRSSGRSGDWRADTTGCMSALKLGRRDYGLYRQIQALGHDCMVVAPALIPKRPGERIKTNRRDAVTLARLHRAGEPTGVWAPDAAHEAVRDLVRAREAAADDLRRKRQRLLSFLLRHSGFTAVAAIGRWRIGAGSPTRSSTMPRSRSSFRKAATRSKMRSNACVGSRSNALSSCRNGP